MIRQKDMTGRPLPLITDTMPGRELRLTYLDQRLYSGNERFHAPHPLSPMYGKNWKDLPY